jgi:hypothetical protein
MQLGAFSLALLTDDQKGRSNYVELEHIFSDVRQLSVYSHVAVHRPCRRD